MDLTQEIQSYAINETFGYRKIIWKILNYFPATCGRDWLIRSPEFYVQSPHLTKWRLNLKPKNSEESSVVTFLERLECSEFQSDVKVKWKLCYLIEDVEGMESESSGTFAREDYIGTEIKDIDHLVSTLFQVGSEDLIVVCYIIVYDHENEALLQKPKDKGLKSLSQDLTIILHSKDPNYVTTIMTGCGSPIRIDKAVISSRNSLFKDIIQEDRLPQIEFPHPDPEGIRFVISFLYSGDLQHVLRIPSFSIEKAVEYFEVDELKKYYSPDELTLQTVILSSETQFIWTVYNIDQITKGYILGHRMRSPSDKIFRLALHPLGISGRSKSMSLEVKFVERIEEEHLFMQFGILDSKKSVLETKYLRYSPNDTRKLILADFAPRRILRYPDYYIDGKFIILSRIQKLDSITNAPVQCKDIAVLPIDKDTHYITLSQEIADMYKTGKYSDYTIECGGKPFKVHRNLISCRSLELGRMIAREKDRTSITLLDIEPDILHIILVYIYSGVLMKCELDEIFKIYDGARILCVQSLKYECSDILAKDIEIKNAINVLIAASLQKDYKLKYVALKFISRHITDIQMQDAWEIFTEKYPPLYEEWTEFYKNLSIIMKY